MVFPISRRSTWFKPACCLLSLYLMFSFASVSMGQYLQSLWIYFFIIVVCFLMHIVILLMCSLEHCLGGQWSTRLHLFVILASGGWSRRIVSTRIAWATQWNHRSGGREMTRQGRVLLTWLLGFNCPNSHSEPRELMSARLHLTAMCQPWPMCSPCLLPPPGVCLSLSLPLNNK